MKLGEKIRVLRDIKGYSQDFLAEKIGISSSALSKMERDLISSNWERITKIAGALDMKPEQLISYGENTSFHFSGNSLSNNTQAQNFSFGNSITNHPSDSIFLLQKIEALAKKMAEMEGKIAELTQKE